MGGQACVLYGAAQFSKDVDFVILAEPENYNRLHRALEQLQAKRIAVPRFDPALLERGHAVHFRCQAPEARDLRVDLMTRLRDLPPFATMWQRRTTIADPTGCIYDLMAMEDLVMAKKTQRDKDWPMISALVEGHHRKFEGEATPERIGFWMEESRGPERLIDLVKRFPAEARALQAQRPLLAHAATGDLDALRTALDAEMRVEQAKDRVYWEPLRREMEGFRREEMTKPE